MTKQELSQLYYLKKEISEINRKITELETLATNGTPIITNMPRSTEISDKVGKNAAKIVDLKNLLENNRKKYLEEEIRLTAFINGIKDSQMRLILILRHIECLSWQQIANKLIYQDESVPRKKYYRFLQKQKTHM